MWNNPPSDEILAIAEATTMTETARRIFFASLPVVEDAESFNEHCVLEDSTVLGCYAAQRIYVYRVTDERLAGTIEVTAAHEMLHAAYERLSGDDRRAVDALVEAFVAQLPDDDPVSAVLEGYPESQHADEWHARVATEFREIGPELEAHYARYFADRAVVIELHSRATAALRELEAEIEALVSEIDALAADLENRGAAYQSTLAALNAEIEAFNVRAAEGDFATQAQFDGERALLIARSDTLESERLALNADTDRYNSLVEELGELDGRYKDLYASLDSTQAPEGVSE